MLALFPTVPVGHQLWATVGMPRIYAPTPGTVIAGFCEGVDGAVFGSCCKSAVHWQAGGSAAADRCSSRSLRCRRKACQCGL